MASQKTWNYDEAYENFYRPETNLKKMGLDKFYAAGGSLNPLQEGGGTEEPLYRDGKFVQLGRTWEDVLRDNAIAMYGPAAAKISPQQWEQIARTRGLLGAKETSWGEDIMEGLQGPLALPALFAGGMAMQGLQGSGMAGMTEAEMMNPAFAGGGEVGSGFAASAPGATGGSFMGGLPSYAQAGMTDVPIGELTDTATGGFDMGGMPEYSSPWMDQPGGAMDMFGGQSFPGGQGGMEGSIWGGGAGNGAYQFPWDKALGAGLGVFGSMQNNSSNADLMNQIMNSDMWRSQQPRYFQPLYDAATKGVGNTAYGQSIADASARKMAAMGYNMSGNQMHEIAQGLNGASMDYVKSVGPLAMGRAMDTGAMANVGMNQQKNNSDMLGNVGYGLGSILQGKQPTSFEQMMGQQKNNTLTQNWSL